VFWVAVEQAREFSLNPAQSLKDRAKKKTDARIRLRVPDLKTKN
jgi:hypothetical protein